MAASEIDDIFAAKGKAAKPPAKSAPATATTQSESSSSSKKSRDRKKRKRDADKQEEKADGEKPAKRRVPETVLDPSLQPAPPTKPPKSTRQPEQKRKHKTINKEEEQWFKDSRGTGPRRRTEEGYLVFKEDELGITDQGGDTPLCPFDCQCCF